MRDTKTFPLTPVAAVRTQEMSAIERAKAHKLQAAGVGKEVGNQLMREMESLETTAEEAAALGDYLSPGVKQAAADIQRELRAIRERLMATMSKGTA